MTKFKPGYVWPNPAFPFRLYLNHPKCRVFLIENLTHNWPWLEMYARHFKPTDHFAVIVGSYHGPDQIRLAAMMFEALPALKKDNFHILFNSEGDKQSFENFGFKGIICNQNAWLDESNVMRPQVLEKKYDAIYVGRRIALKRHMLASKIDRLALIVGDSHRKESLSPVPAHVYMNDAPLSPAEVCTKINQSHCGLILSEREGANFASSEYLLCGIPVVSTASEGGRDVWYNKRNSIIVEPTVEAVAEAVTALIREKREPAEIRALHVAQAQAFRSRFVALIADILQQHAVTDLDPGGHFTASFFHKMRKSHKPDFPSLFPAVC